MSKYIWHPFTQMRTAAEPIQIERGSGALLFDAEGNRYIDAVSSWWTNLHGHAHPHIADKIAEQAKILEHVIFAGFTHSPAETIAKRLIENYLPGNITKIFFSDNGSTSVEVAIKMAIQYWKNTGEAKNKIIAFENAYHGDTFGSMSVSDRSAFTQPFHAYLFEAESIPVPVKENAEEICLQFETLARSEKIAAFIYEPLIQGAGGMLQYAPEHLEALLQIAKKYGIICIADEVMTGFYRTGKFFASDHCATKPDIMCLSKGLTGGTMALGITACAQYIFDAFYSTDKMKALYHGHSFTANPLACAAANASLDLIEEPGFTDRIANIVLQHQTFAARLSAYRNIENIRQCGTIIAFDFISEGGTQYFNSIRDSLYNYFIGHGVLLRPLGNTVYIMPPYCITDNELEKVYAVIENFPAKK